MTRLFTVKEAAEIIGIDPSRVRHYIREGRLETVAPRGERVTDTALYAFIKARVNKSKARKYGPKQHA